MVKLEESLTIQVVRFAFSNLRTEPLIYFLEVVFEAFHQGLLLSFKAQAKTLVR